MRAGALEVGGMLSRLGARGIEKQWQGGMGIRHLLAAETSRALILAMAAS
jgi:hypothetical protein